MNTELTEQTFSVSPRKVDITIDKENKYLGIWKYAYELSKTNLHSNAVGDYYDYFSFDQVKELFLQLAASEKFRKFSFDPNDLREKFLTLINLKILTEEEAFELYEKLPKQYNFEEALNLLKTSKYNFEETLAICMIVVKWALKDLHNRPKASLDYLLLTQEKYNLEHSEERKYFWEDLENYFFKEIQLMFQALDHSDILHYCPCFLVPYYLLKKDLEEITIRENDQFYVFEEVLRLLSKDKKVSLKIVKFPADPIQIKKIDIIQLRDLIILYYEKITEVNITFYKFEGIDELKVRELLKDTSNKYNVKVGFHDYINPFNLKHITI